MEHRGSATTVQEPQPSAASDRTHANNCCYPVGTADLARWGHLFPLRESSYTQLKPGRFDIQGTLIKAGPVIAFQNVVRSASLSHQVPDPSYLAFILPLRWQGNYVIDGRAVSPTSLFLSAGPNGYVACGEARETVVLGVKRDLFIDTVAALQGVDREDVVPVGGALDLDAAEVGKLRRLLLRQIDWARNDCGEFLTEDASFSISDTMVVALAEAYLSVDPLPGRNRNGDLPAQAILNKAMDLMYASPDRRITIAELCRVAGVGATALNAAFHEICGEPPLKVVRLQRLMKVRNTLLHETPQRSAVKRVALSHGFTEAGRFAAEYQRLFGELPSDTLHRQVS